MRDLLISKVFNLRISRSPIIPIYIEDHNILRVVVNELYLQGIYSTPVVFPIVKVNEGRIRFILNYNHTKEQIDYTVQALEKVCRKYQII
jgi:glycine C-acetyltransferase